MTSPQPAPKVAIYHEFLDSFAKLPRPQQKKVSEFLRKFRDNPTSGAIHYEKIADFRDPNLRTVRIDLAWRAIVLRPDRGDVYVLLWVDHHDEAMAWARNKRVEVHPETGALQVFVGETVREAVTSSTVVERPVQASPNLFAMLSDEQLLTLGVPAAGIDRVRLVDSRTSLEALRTELPGEAVEALSWLADGETFATVSAVVEDARKPAARDDFAAALSNPESQRAFYVVDDEASLAAVLDAPLDKWRVFLHPSQRRLVELRAKGPVRVLGGAGTGKTVVAMHRAVWLARNTFRGAHDRILFTTFTKNLALDIRKNLEALAEPQVLDRIDVVHIDRLVSDLLRGAGYSNRIAYWGGPDRILESAWAKAVTEAPSDLALPRGFYRDEWDLVVQPAACRTWEAYRDASRSGRGVRLSRAQRQAIWPVFARYRELLDRGGVREPEDALLDASDLVTAGAIRTTYRAAVIDESQDLATAAFRFLRRLVPEGENDLFLVGDGHQRIYRRRVVLSQALVNVVGRSHRLRINYRTTDEIRSFASALLAGKEIDDLDNGLDTLRGYRSLTHGPTPTVRCFDTFDEEVDALAVWIASADIDRTCLVARTTELRDEYAASLRKRGIESYALSREKAEDRSKPGLRVATMHRVKGLEFDRVVLAGAGAANVPWPKDFDRSEDVAIREDADLQERALVYVALTRARKAALITTNGAPSVWLRSSTTDPANAG